MCPKGAARPVHRLGAQPGWPSSAALLGPSAPAHSLYRLPFLADALAALEAREVVHRDVKGGNVLVRRTDGRAMLMDFGTGLSPGAATLTLPLWFPGTPAYRSPESWLFKLQFRGDTSARYRAAPADDLYALVETILGKRGISIAARAAVRSLRAAVWSSYFKHFPRHDGGWSARVQASGRPAARIS